MKKSEIDVPIQFTMTPEIVSDRLAFMRSSPEAYENHQVEDDLYSDLIAAIGQGKCRNPKRCAQLAITSKGLSFPRYTA